MRLNTRRRYAIATLTGLPRYARNDKVGNHKAQHTSAIRRCYGDGIAVRYARNDKVPDHPEPVEGRGNLDAAEHTSAIRHCYADGIAALRSQ